MSNSGTQAQLLFLKFLLLKSCRNFAKRVFEFFLKSVALGMNF